MERQSLIPALVSVVIVSVLVIGVLCFRIYRKKLIGPTVILLGLPPLIPLRISGRTVTSTGADIIFGAIDTGFLGIMALIGASFAGVLGAIVGGAVGDSITDVFAGLF
jgi:hypothetical protein